MVLEGTSLLLAIGGFGLAIIVGLGIIQVGRNNKNMRNTVALGVIVGIVGLWMGGVFAGLTGAAPLTAAPGATGQATTLLLNDNEGDQVTIGINAFTGPWGEDQTETEVFPVWTVLDHNGEKIINDATANTTTGIVGKSVSLYCTGAAFYCDALVDESVEDASAKSVNAYAASALANLQVRVFDEDDNVLTADDNANNTADYAGGNFVADETKEFRVNFENRDADNTFDLGMICTWYPSGQEVDDVEISLSGWSESMIPETLRDASITARDDGNASTTSTFKHCYTPNAGVVRLNEFDEIDVPLQIDTDDSTQPTANGDSHIGITFFDTAYSVDGSGAIVRGPFMDDGTEDPGAVGIDESGDTTFNGLQIAAQVELQ